MQSLMAHCFQVNVLVLCYWLPGCGKIHLSGTVLFRCIKIWVPVLPNCWRTSALRYVEMALPYKLGGRTKSVVYSRLK